MPATKIPFNAVVALTPPSLGVVNITDSTLPQQVILRFQADDVYVDNQIVIFTLNDVRVCIVPVFNLQYIQNTPIDANARQIDLR